MLFCKIRNRCSGTCDILVESRINRVKNLRQYTEIAFTAIGINCREDNALYLATHR